MIELFDELTDSLYYSIPIALVILSTIMLYLRRRLVHVFEPIIYELMLASFGIAGFAAIYRPTEYAWKVVFAGVLLAILPVVYLYRRSPVVDPLCLEKRARLSATLEFKVLITIFLAIQIVAALIVLASTGFSVGEKIKGPMIMRSAGQLIYFHQVTTNFFPAMLLITRRTKLFYLVVVALILCTLTALASASRASLVLPLFLGGAAFFMHQLDNRTTHGWKGNSVVGKKNLIIAAVAVGTGAMLAAVAAVIFQIPAETFLFAFLMRFFLSVDSLFQAIQFSLVQPAVATAREFSVLLTYTQPVHKLLGLNLHQEYNNLGEYIAVNVYHIDIWKNPELALLAMPNSNMVLEFLLSFDAWVALVLIPIYAALMILAIGWFEQRRYEGIGFFCAAQFLLMNPLQFFFDGTSFVVCLYALGALIVLVKMIAFAIEQFAQHTGERTSEQT